MKNQAGSIGEQGFKFAGMNSEMLVIVNDFATNLREGKMDLPLHDRSVELLKENKRLKEEQREMNLRYQTIRLISCSRITLVIYSAIYLLK
jgi:hypothetical protein